MIENPIIVVRCDECGEELEVRLKKVHSEFTDWPFIEKTMRANDWRWTEEDGNGSGNEYCEACAGIPPVESGRPIAASSTNQTP